MDGEGLVRAVAEGGPHGGGVRGRVDHKDSDPTGLSNLVGLRGDVAPSTWIGG